MWQVVNRIHNTMAKQLIYFADPMCSWCWGFSPVISAIREQFGSQLPVRLIMGGLRPGNTTPMKPSDKTYIREHWEHVQKATGQPFDFTFFERDGFVYDTEPASRAIVTARRLKPELALDYLAVVQEAFYAHAKDTTNLGVLGSIAALAGLDEAAFRAGFESDETASETRADFTIARKTGISGFPSLLAGDGENPYKFVCTGYQSWPDIKASLVQWFHNDETAKEKTG